MNRILCGILALGIAVATPRLAGACGGCFSPPPAPTASPEDASVVTDHRMVLSLSERETTLWDQIKYSGNPTDFVWVLPVADASTLRFGLADDNFVNALDQFSAPEIIARYAGCILADGGGAVIGCSASFPSGDGGTPGGAQESTRIMRDGEAVVGPYDVSVISTENGGMRLDEWLTQNGYQVPAQLRSVIGFYVGLQFDFIALRLRPGAGVQEMQPVRVTTRGYSPILPLRMVAAGVGEKVGLSLMVIASTRVEARNFDNVEISENDLTWDWTANHSNYRDLFQSTIAAHNGRAWVIESVQNLLSSELAYPIGWGPGHAGSDSGFDGSTSMMQWLDGGSDDASLAPDMDAGDTFTPHDGGAMELDDAGRMQPTDPFIDRRVAFEGIGSQAVITRMRTELNATDLDTDLILDGASDGFIPAQYVISSYYGQCPPTPRSSYACAVIGGSTPVALEGLFVALAILKLRRYRRQKKTASAKTDAAN